MSVHLDGHFFTLLPLPSRYLLLSFASASASGEHSSSGFSCEFGSLEVSIIRAADRLDVSPRRVRAALRDILAATENAQGALRDVAQAAQDPDAPTEGDTAVRDRDL